MDKLNWWEKAPIVGLFAAQGLYVWSWYTDMAPWSTVVAMAGLAAVAAIDGAMVATVAGMRAGRRSRASVAAIIVTASFGAAVALDLYDAITMVSAWLHAGFALTIVCYLLHLAGPADAPMPMLAIARQEVFPEPEMVQEAEAFLPGPEAIHAPYACPHCGASLPTAGALGAARRWGHCPQCKETH